MAVFESLVNVLKALAVGDRVRVTLRPETGHFPNPIDGEITEKNENGNFWLKSQERVIQVRTSDVLSVTKLKI
jgi:hypothetical protein